MTQSKIIQNRISTITSFLTPLLSLANNHMVDYFNKNLYENCLPSNLRDEIQSVGYDEVLKVILSNEPNLSTASLNSFIASCENLQLCKMADVCLPQSNLDKKLLEWAGDNLPSFKLKTLSKQKKSHEVEVLAKIAASLSHYKTTTHLIDIGDGKGYLSSMLAFHYNIPVLGVDFNLKNTNSSVERTKKFVKTLKKSISDEQFSYRQITHFVTENTNFKQLVTDVFLTNGERYGLIGLHTCGDLGSTSVKLFNSCEYIRTLCNVSCCYHLLTDEEDTKTCNTNVGFPLSNFLKNNNFTLSRNARMLSSQSIDRIRHNKELPKNTLFYRALLQLKFIKYEISDTQIGKQRKKFNNFNDYATNVFEKLNFTLPNDELNELFDCYKNREKELYVYFFLKCLLAPVIESLILLDRLLYLHENNHESAFLVQLFDPVISPRCYGLIALKED